MQLLLRVIAWCCCWHFQDELRREIARLREDVRVLRRSLPLSLRHLYDTSAGVYDYDYDYYNDDDETMKDWGRRLLYDSQVPAVSHPSRHRSPGRPRYFTF